MVGAVLMGAGMGLSMFSSYQQSRSQAQAMKYNANVKRRMADQVEQASEYEVRQRHKQAREFKASQTAAYASSGAMIDSGTPLMILVEQAGKIEMDIINQRRASLNQARQMRNEASQMDHAAKQIKKGAILTAFGGGMGTGGQLYGMMGTGGGSGSPSDSGNYSSSGSSGGGNSYNAGAYAFDFRS